jgi:cytochrome bd-type quinol oxidase subunit 2
MERRQIFTPFSFRTHVKSTQACTYLFAIALVNSVKKKQQQKAKQKSNHYYHKQMTTCICLGVVKPLVDQRISSFFSVIMGQK